MTVKKEQELTVRKRQTEVCVVGGGLSGICAAIAVARNGAKNPSGSRSSCFSGDDHHSEGIHYKGAI